MSTLSPPAPPSGRPFRQFRRDPCRGFFIHATAINHHLICLCIYPSTPISCAPWRQKLSPRPLLTPGLMKIPDTRCGLNTGFRHIQGSSGTLPPSHHLCFSFLPSLSIFHPIAYHLRFGVLILNATHPKLVLHTHLKKNILGNFTELAWLVFE